MLDYRLRNNLTVGLEHDGESEVLPRFTWFAVPMTDKHPSLTIGMSSDRLSIPRGSAIFFTASKTVAGSSVTPFVSAKYATDTKDWAIPFGVNLMQNGNTLQAIHDGAHTHLIYTMPKKFGSVSFMLGRMKHPGLSISVGW